MYLIGDTFLDFLINRGFTRLGFLCITGYRLIIEIMQIKPILVAD